MPSRGIVRASYALVDLVSRSESGEVLFQQSCQTRYVPDQQIVEWLGPADRCGRWGNGASLATAPLVGNVALEADTLTVSMIVHDQPPSRHVYAENLGIVRVTTNIPGGKENYDLLYARVAGSETGHRGLLPIWQEFDPRGLGDEWIYASTDAQHPPQTTYHRELVLDRQVVDGVAHVQLQVERWTGAGILLEREVVALASDSLKLCYARSSGECWRTSPDLRQPRQRFVESVTIGGLSYPNRDVWRESHGSNMGHSSRNMKIRYIGFFESYSWRYGSGGGTSFSYMLRYARVSGQEYGSRPFVLPTSTDGPPLASSVRVALVGANPALQTALEVTAASPFTVLLYDALGRLLAVSQHPGGGISRVDLDLRPWSVGVYTAVVRAVSGEQATLRLVRP